MIAICWTWRIVLDIQRLTRMELAESGSFVALI